MLVTIKALQAGSSTGRIPPRARLRKRLVSRSRGGGCRGREGLPEGGFSLVEVLIVTAVISVLAGLVLAAVNHSRGVARDVVCYNNLRQLGVAAQVYANGYEGHFPPLGYANAQPPCYWWGTNEDPPDYGRGFLAPYLGEAGKDGDVYQCPEQPPGSYTPEGIAGALTTTYGYNGYFLCPPAAPGWDRTIGQMPWQTFHEISNPSQVFMFADAMLSWGKDGMTNTSFLDPPFLYTRGRWRPNANPTTCFRHGGRANICFVDGHVGSLPPTRLTSPEHNIGYVGESNHPHYVPDYAAW